MKKKGLISLMLTGVMATSVGVMSGCDEYNGVEGDYNFVVVLENEKEILHKISNYENRNSDKIIKTECCHNTIEIPTEKVVLYKNKPQNDTFDIECSLNK